MKNFFYLLSVFMLMIISCSQNYLSETKYNIKFKKNTNINLSKYISKVECHLIETPKDINLKRINNIFYSNNFIIITDGFSNYNI